MEVGRFAGIDDLYDPDTDDRTPLAEALYPILEDIIRKQFENLETFGPNLVYGIEDVDGDEKSNGIYFEATLSTSHELFRNGSLYTDDFLDEFIDRMGDIKGSLMKKLRVLDTETLRAIDLPADIPRLSPDQFVIRCRDVSIRPNIVVHAGQPVVVQRVIKVRLVLTIEDISQLEPDEHEALRLRYLALCKSGVGSYTELSEWADRLGIQYFDTPSKEMLCRDIAAHYGF